MKIHDLRVYAECLGFICHLSLFVALLSLYIAKLKTVLMLMLIFYKMIVFVDDFDVVYIIYDIVKCQVC